MLKVSISIIYEEKIALTSSYFRVLAFKTPHLQISKEFPFTIL